MHHHDTHSDELSVVEGAEHDRAVTHELLERCLLTRDRMLTLPGRIPRWRAPVTLPQLEAGPALDVERVDLLGAIEVRIRPSSSSGAS